MRELKGEKLEKELLRLEAMKEYERRYPDTALVCGIDEAGRGPLAGPVVAAAAILPRDSVILRLNDSKKLSESCREELFSQIKEKAISYGVGIVSPEVIDSINILQATYEAMRQAVGKLSVRPDIFLNDAVIIPGIEEKRQISIVKGDAKSVSIAAASILAKVTRDHMMIEYDRIYPQYGFAKHKGYGTKAHTEALREYGPCPIHRKTFLKKMNLSENPAAHKSREIGKKFENEAADFLKECGYEILERNYCCRQGEIDIIARDGNTLVFVEAKARSTAAGGDPADAVDREKRQHILRTARFYMVSKGMSEDTSCRFDVITSLDGELRLIRDAFWED